jgi:hypothetical protein
MPLPDPAIHRFEIVYQNYRGEIATRHIIPRQIFFGSTSYHPNPQWLMRAYDLDKEDDRVFALIDVSDWKRIETSSLEH